MSWSFLNLKISMNETENVQNLTLVLVYSLDLNIIDGINWNIDTAVVLDPLLQADLVVSLDLDKSFNKRFIVSVGLQLSQGV